MDVEYTEGCCHPLLRGVNHLGADAVWYSKCPDCTAGCRSAREAVIPGGFHLSGRPLLGTEDGPLYFERGRGCRIWDVDGHEYVDFIMAYGPFLLGYANERIDAAAREQARAGNLLSLNHPLHVAFAERLLRSFPAADMVIAEAQEIVPVGVVAPDDVMTPAVLVDRLVAKERVHG